MNLQRVRSVVLNYFGSSRFWTAWCWVKSEWQLARKSERLDFLCECRRQKTVPRFLHDKIKTRDLFRFDDHRIRTGEKNYGLQTLSLIIRKEIRERSELRATATRNRKNMFEYNKEEYLFTKKVKDQLTKSETTKSGERLRRKLENLMTTKTSPVMTASIAKERVTCIGTTIDESQKMLLEKGPKFVPTAKVLSINSLRAVESEIESMMTSLRRKYADEAECENGPANGRNENNATSRSNTGEEADEMPHLLAEPKIRRLIRHTQHAKQPPKMDVENERQLSDLKARIIKAYREYHPSNYNITKAEESATRTLKQSEIVIKCSDKSKSLVVMKDDIYRTKAEAILSDPENHEPANIQAEELTTTISEELKKLKSLKKQPNNVYRNLFPQESRLPEFYGLPKIHKANAPLRPVVAAFDGPLTPISIFLERILHQLLRFVPAHIDNTAAATASLNEAFQQEGTREKAIIVSMDVVALYPSIPIEDGISAVIEKLAQHEEDVDTAGVSINDIESLLRLVLNNNYFKFGDKTFRQRKGVAMGNHLAPPLAIVFMDRLEQRMLQTAHAKPEFFDRYVDDCLMVWTHGEAELIRFMEHCNRQHPNIRFTWESSLGGKSVSYMDLLITIGRNYQLEFELFQKPSDSGVNLNHESCIPKHVKLSVATQQFRRAHALSSNATTEARSIQKVKTLLGENGFPQHAIENAAERSRKTSKRKSAAEKKKDQFVTLRLPFCSDNLDTTVRRFVRKSKQPIRIVNSQARNLKSRLVHSAFSARSCAVHERFNKQQQATKKRRGKPCDDCLSCQAGIKGSDCDKKGAIYSLQCKLCSKEYIGETQRPIRARLLEHHANARNRSKETPWGEHMRDHPEEQINKTPVFTARIIATEHYVVTRKAREAIEIRDRKPAINRNKGWRLD